MTKEKKLQALYKASQKLLHALERGVSDKKLAQLEWNVRYLQAISK